MLALSAGLAQAEPQKAPTSPPCPQGDVVTRLEAYGTLWRSYALPLDPPPRAELTPDRRPT